MSTATATPLPSPTPETDELIDGLAAVGASLCQAIEDDGRVSFAEGLGLLRNIPAVSRAIDGVSAIPAEVMNAHMDVHMHITDKIVNQLGAFRVPHLAQDIAGEVSTWLLFTLRTVVRVKEMLATPVAERVES